MNIESDLIAFISKAAKIPKNEIRDDTEIYRSGIVSSLVILELMNHIEQQYGVVIKPEKLIEDNFRDIRTITGFVQELVDSRMAS